MRFFAAFSGGAGLLLLAALVPGALVTQADSIPGFVVVQSSGTTIVVEGGAPDSFTVVLNALPSADVILLVTSGNAEQATVDKSSLTFTEADWNVAQTVNVSAVSDGLSDGCQMLLPGVVVSVLDGSSAPEYGAVFDFGFSVTILDSGTTPSLGIIESDGNTVVTESRRSTDTFTVELTSIPCNGVTVEVRSGDPDQVLVSSPSLPGLAPSSVLTFSITPATWNEPRTISVTGVNDRSRDGDQVIPITISIVDALSSVEYRTLADRMVNVTALAMHRPRP